MNLLRSPLQLMLLAFCSLFIFCQHPTPPPAPTSGKVNPDAEENEDNADAKEQWFAMMHRSAPDVNWQRIEFKNRLERHIKRRNTSQLRSDREVLANGTLTGKWRELGSRNNAGSVLATEYDAETDKIYLISAGGTLWRGNRNNDDWVPLNEDLQFQSRFLEQILLPDSTKRFLALSGGIPLYSDDEGATWNTATGINPGDNGGSDRALLFEHTTKEIFVLSKPGYWTDLSLYVSTDNGETYQSVQQFHSNNYNNFSLLQPHHSEDLFLLEKRGEDETDFYKRNAQGQLDTLPNANFSFGSARANLVGTYDAQTDSTTLYAYATRSVNGNRITTLFRSGDEGLTWEELSEIPTNPWQVGLFISPSDPQVLLAGAVECYRSPDGGLNWNQVNRWQDYYQDIVTKLHADMMVFDEFVTQDSQTFQLISNHGGLNISYDWVQNVSNIGLDGLNVGQFYDVQTDPLFRNWVYGGTQDQGFQRAAITDEENPIPMEQVWSGDYGHMAFTLNQSALWTVYPGGLVYRYNNVRTDPYPFSGWRLESDDESVWIPPLIADPDPTKDITYLAGGNPEGGPGSYIIKLSHQPWEISPEKLSDFDFKLESGGGEVSALAYSPLDSMRWYAATTNGRFFYSEDRGVTWDQGLEFVPGGQYLYGASIFPSPVDEDIVYFAGSGYSNPPVHVSRNGGFTFSPMSEGLPPTLVIELTGDPEGNFLFAATESGPYVYSFAEQRWFDMAGSGAPAQTYWSVEYLADLEKVRFGTYGRGIWDFEIETTTVSTETATLYNNQLSLFPNPSNGQFTFRYQDPLSDQWFIKIYDINGKLLDLQQIKGTTGTFQQSLDYSKLPRGTYLLILEDGTQQAAQRFIIQ